VDVAGVASWTSGRLQFNATPLAAALAEVNRYADAPVILEATEFATRPLSGTFDTGDPAAFAEAVAQIYGLNLVTRSDRAVVLRRSVEN